MRKKLFFIILIFFLSAFRIEDSAFKTLDDKTLGYKELTAGSDKTILFLWTSWCYICRRELTKINSQPYNADKVKIYYVNIGETENTVSHITDRLKLGSEITENIVLDQDGATAQEFNVIGVPTYIFFEKGELIHISNYISDGIINDIFRNAS
ncbi:MAG: TlpA disulfide reductase family protein [Candidatus Omnitrophota bacterium]